MTVDQLREEAKKIGVTGGLSKLTKAQLTEKILAINGTNDESPEMTLSAPTSTVVDSKKEKRIELRKTLDRAEDLIQRIIPAVEKSIEEFLETTEDENVQEFLEGLLEMLVVEEI